MFVPIFSVVLLSMTRLFSLPLGALAPALMAALVVAAPAGLAQPVEPWLTPEPIAAGGDPSFRGTLGYGITLTQARTLRHLGFWDELGDGLLSAHTVSVWEASGGLLTSAVIPAGITAPLWQGFRWVPIAPIRLTPGSYVLGASMEGEAATFDEVITETSSIATVLGLEWRASGALRGTPVAPGAPISPGLLPTIVDGGGGYFGPNAAPGPLPLLAGGAGWSWSRRLRARRRSVGSPSPAASAPRNRA